MSTKLLHITFVLCSSRVLLCTYIEYIPEFSIFFASSRSTLSPSDAMISPVEGSTAFSASTQFSILFASPSFLLYLYLPTLAISYLFGSKNRELSSDEALSFVGGSPGLSFLYISLRPSSLVLVGSLSSVFLSLSSSPKSAMISSSVSIERSACTPNLSASLGTNSFIALMRVVIGCFLVLSTLTDMISFESVSYSSHAPRFGITVVE